MARLDGSFVGQGSRHPLPQEPVTELGLSLIQDFDKSSFLFAVDQIGEELEIPNRRRRHAKMGFGAGCGGGGG